MKKVFVSVPFAGRIEADIRADMEIGMKQYCKEHPGEEIAFIDNYCCQGHTRVINDSLCKDRVWYLGQAISKIAYCDDVIFCGDWQNSPGCQVEKLVYNLYFSK